jgi:hypothetical protein
MSSLYTVNPKMQAKCVKKLQITVLLCKLSDLIEVKSTLDEIRGANE